MDYSVSESPFQGELPVGIKGAGAPLRHTPRKNASRQLIHRFVSHLVESDESGRVAQIACTCPGLLVLLGAFHARGREHEIREIQRAIVGGERLGGILERAALHWITLVPARDRAYPGRDQRQRLFLRLAGPQVEAKGLWRGAPPVLVAEDIPKSRSGNAIWYRFIYRVLPAIRWASGIISAEQHRDLCGFVSRHALELEQMYASGKRNPGLQLRLMALYAGVSGRHIGRNTNVDKLLGEMESLHDRQVRRRRQRALALVDEGAARRPFPASPLISSLPRREGEVLLELLPDPAAVFKEALEMDHCVADYIPAAAGGACHILRATVDGQALTVLIEREPSSDSFRVSEIAGKANRKPSRAELEAVRRCFRGLGFWA